MLAGFVVRTLLVLLPAFGLALGFALPSFGQAAWQDRVWATFTIPVLTVLVWEDCCEPATRRSGPRYRRGPVDGSSARRRRGTGRGRRRADVCRRAIPRSVCRTPCTPRDDGAAGAGTSNRGSTSDQWPGRSRAGLNRARRPSVDPAGRCDPGRRRRGERACGTGSIRAHRRVVSCPATRRR